MYFARAHSFLYHPEITNCKKKKTEKKINLNILLSFKFTCIRLPVAHLTIQLLNWTKVKHPYGTYTLINPGNACR